MTANDTAENLIARHNTYRLEDRYSLERGRVFLTGTQALVRLPLLQAAFDRARGLNTAGFISGYRGSPLGGYDKELWGARKFMQKHNVDFLPAINEDLAATAVMGTQQVESSPDREVDGVFGIWYGKGPGVDRAGDALKHGNAYGSSPHGGVLVLAGDDHGCVSSSMSHQSDVAFMAYFMPTLNPASVEEYLQFGLYGFELSRFSGCWVGFKAISETVESGASVSIDGFPEFTAPTDYTAPDYGLHYRWPDLPGPQIEARMVEKLNAVRAFARANPIDHRIYDIADAEMGIVTTGKSHLDLMEAFKLLGLTGERLRQLGIDVYKVGMVWPMETEGARAFLRGKKEVLVVEEKRGIIESQLKEFLYDYQSDKPHSMIGKYDEDGNPVIPWTGELSPTLLAQVVAKRIQHLFPAVSFESELRALEACKTDVSLPADIKRSPFFCAGCPHNTSTRVPDGSRALAGIGCHFMASWMGRNTESLVQMGGEGVNWAARSRFLKNKHVFQNLGEGTYFHSGYMAIRQAVAARANITYKILFNDAVAMTGGQPVDGVISVDAIARQVRAEGVQRIAIVSDEPQKYTDKSIFPQGASFHSRDDMDPLQRELREVPGVSVLIYDQACAAEKRRRRKRGSFPDPAKRMFINEAVCEGCGVCSVQSNCLSIYPVETELGRKRKIDQSSCNKDYSCVKGFCPSFVTVEGGELHQLKRELAPQEMLARVEKLDAPQLPSLDDSYNLVVAGVGGTGVVTVGALVTMAAHLENKGATVLDFTGFAQKGGAVISHIRIGRSPQAINQVRIAEGQADTMIACDVLVGTDQRCTRILKRGATRILANLSEVPSGQFVLNRNADMQTRRRIGELQRVVGEHNLTSIDANVLMERLMGHSVYSNVFLLGMSWQKGLIPVSDTALMEAIELNAVNIEQNKTAFNWGRLAAVEAQFVLSMADLGERPRLFDDLDGFIDARVKDLQAYQNAAYADQYLDLVKRVRAAEASLSREDEALSWAVGRFLFKLMAYKDEYEVARLYTNGEFAARLKAAFAGNYKIKFNLAPPLIRRRKDAQGRPLKTTFGPWMFQAFRLLARFKFLRGTALDPFGRLEERRQERRLIDDYRGLINELLSALSAANYDAAVRCASLPDDIRGYGPVKELAIRQYYERRADALQNFHSPEAIVRMMEAA